jgi:hypothetical protein
LRDFRNGSHKCNGEVRSLPATALSELLR